jgi:gas vesicle protein
MDPTQQMEEMIKTWTDTQKKMWDTFFTTVQSAGRMPGNQAWQQTIGMGEELLKGMLNTQSEWIATWVDSLSDFDGVPEPALESAKQFREMTRQWAKTQEQLLGNWFAMLKKLAPAQPADVLMSMPQEMFKTWQSTTQTIMDAQMEWMRSWTKSTRKTQ